MSVQQLLLYLQQLITVAGTITGTTTDPLTYSTQGTHTINWTFDDGNGNVISVPQNVVINDISDPTTPTLTNVTGECTATASVPTTTDNCSWNNNWNNFGFFNVFNARYSYNQLDF